MPESSKARWNQRERGISLLMVAIGLLVLLSISALAIDLVTLYVGRNEAQRAADAAALAGAKTFVDSGFTSGLVTQTVVQTLATNRAITVGGENKVGGQPAAIQASDVTPDFSSPGNPRITVVAQRTAARGNAMPVFFAKAFGVLSGDVAAAATAEAYNASGSNGPTLCTECLKPVVLPNCDPDTSHVLPAPSPFCPGYGKFVDPTCQLNPSYPGICHPGPVSQGGVIGARLRIRPGVPGTDTPAPSQYYSLAIGGTGASIYNSNIRTCATAQFACGDTLRLETGAMVGPTRQGFIDLIHQPGQDTIDTTNIIHAGRNNPMVLAGLIPVGAAITSSDSLVTVPLYDGRELCPGGSCGFDVTIVGYLQVFVVDVVGQANVDAVILNISGCGSIGGTCGSGGGGGTISGGGGALIPVRLVRNPGT